MASYIELKKQAEELLAKAEEARQAEVSAKIAEIRKDIAAYGITAKELGFSVGDGKKQAAAKGQVVGGYRSPNGEFWSGKGRMPFWMRDRIDAGAKREDFAV